MSRRKFGRETWSRLLEWDVGQAPSERLACRILEAEGYESIDPSHPLGGKDGGKDILCKKDDIELIGAVYFPRGQQKFSAIKTKFTSDLNGVEKNSVKGIVFVTNQELKLSERKELSDINKEIVVEIYHLERIATILDSPANYGIRFDFLDIEMTKEEFLSYQALRDMEYYEKSRMIYEKVSEVIERLDEGINDLIGYSVGGDSYGCIDLLHFNKDPDIKNFIFKCVGTYPLFNIGIRFADLDDNSVNLGLHDSIEELIPNTCSMLSYVANLRGRTEKKYNIFISARNGHFTEILRLYKVNGEWVSALRIIKGKDILFEKIDDKCKDRVKWES